MDFYSFCNRNTRVDTEKFINVVVYVSVFLGYSRYYRTNDVTIMNVNHAGYGVPMCYENLRRTPFERVNVIPFSRY